MKNAKVKSKSKRIKERYISNEKGRVEYVILPIKRYTKILELLEDYGLAKAIKETEKDKKYSVEDALIQLND